MPSAQRTILIASPPERVFAFFTDPSNDQRWRPHPRRWRPRELFVSVPRSTSRRRTRWARIPADIEVPRYEPLVALCVQGDRWSARPVGEFPFAPAEGGTE
jgi:uncharacterized protein YndB with AHSA1/START domain